MTAVSTLAIFRKSANMELTSVVSRRTFIQSKKPYVFKTFLIRKLCHGHWLFKSPFCLFAFYYILFQPGHQTCTVFHIWINHGFAHSDGSFTSNPFPMIPRMEFASSQHIELQSYIYSLPIRISRSSSWLVTDSSNPVNKSEVLCPSVQLFTRI